MAEITLYARQKQIISILNGSHSVETGRSLASRLGISERTVRNEVREINSRLSASGIRIVAHHGKGYTLEVTNRPLYLELFSQQENYLTREDRIRTLILLLLETEGWYDLGDLEDDMLVSRTTLESDLRTVKKRICVRYPYLEIRRRENAVCMEDDERKKRALLTRLYAENWDYDSRNGIVLRQDQLDAGMLSRIRETVIRVLTKDQVCFNDLGMIYLTLSIAVMYVRIRSGHVISRPQMDTSDADADRAAASILDDLKEEWGLALNREEYRWLASIMYQLRLVNLRELSREETERLTDAPSRQIVLQIVELVRDEYLLDFTEDHILFVDLVLHIMSLKSGIIATQMQNHVYGDELRRRYPFLGDIVHNVRLRLEEWCAMDLWEDEEDCLLPMFVSAERRLYKKNRGSGIPVAVVSHMNPGMTGFLMDQLKKYYGDALDLKGPCAVYDRAKLKGEHPMLVLTTVQMKDFSRIFDVPVVTVSALIDEADRAQLEPHLEDIKCRFLYPPLPADIRSFFREDLICRVGGKDSLAAAIAAVQDQMYLKKYMVEKIAVDLEEDYIAEFPGGLIFLSQTDAHIAHTVMSLAELAKPVSWRHARSIRHILFLAVRPQDRKYLGWFYRFAGQLSEDPNLLSEILDQRKS